MVELFFFRSVFRSVDSMMSVTTTRNVSTTPHVVTLSVLDEIEPVERIEKVRIEFRVKGKAGLTRGVHRT